MNYYDFEYRVRYSDTDKMGVSYYANYLVWFEAARTEYFRALGYPYTECEKKGYYLPVREVSVQYFAPSTYDDLLIVRTSVGRISKSSIRFEYQIVNQSSSKILATGFTLHVFVGKNLKPCRIPAEIETIVTLYSLLT